MHLQQTLHCTVPIVQAPMAGVQGYELAAAVCNAGGLGSVPAAMLTADALRAELTALRQATTAAYNVNFFCHTQPEPDAKTAAAWQDKLAPYCAELGVDASDIPSGPGRLPFNQQACEVLEEFKPAVVSFHFGLPPPALLARVRAWGAQVWSSATTVAEAQWLQAHGADVVIAQGLEAGGHRGHFLNHDLSLQTGTFALLPQVVKALSIPVVAAGGIADARGVQAVLGLGAAAAQIGTAYLLCPQAKTSALHRAALLSDAAQHTALTNVFTGRPARGIVNRFMRELGPLNPCAPEFPLATNASAPLRAAAEKAGSADFSPLWAGQNTSGCKAVDAGELTRELTRKLAA
jgi:nitronate monooxygenase